MCEVEDNKTKTAATSAPAITERLSLPAPGLQRFHIVELCVSYREYMIVISARSRLAAHHHKSLAHYEDQFE